VRVRIIFLLKNKGGYVPFYHQFLLARLAEELLADTDFAGREDFHFSGLKGQTKISKSGLHFYSSRITLVLASPNAELIDCFLQKLFEQKNTEIGMLQLEPEAVEREWLPDFKGDHIKCVCISPIVIMEPGVNEMLAKKFISPETDGFSDMLYESTMSRMEKSGAYTAEQIASFYKFQVVPDKGYLQRIREGEKKFARIYPVFNQDNKLEVRGYTFPFTLYCAPEVQEFLFTSGIGYFTHKGFGMLDISNADLNRKTEIYQFNEVRQLSQTPRY
jgi:CRISPR-associated endoribonuclease Cas6